MSIPTDKSGQPGPSIGANPPQVSSSAAKDGAVVAGRGAVFIAFSKAFFMVMGMVQRVALGRVLGSAEYGAFSVVNGLISTVNNTMVQGTIQGISKFTAETDGNAEPVKWAGLRLQAFLGTAVGVGFFAVAPLIVSALELGPDYLTWLRVVSAIPVLYGFYAVFVGSANGLCRFRAQAGFDVGFSIIKTVLLLSGAAIFARVWTPRSAVTGAFVGFVLAAVVILLIARRVMGLAPRRDVESFPAARLLPFMGGVVVYAGLLNLALNYDLWWLRYFAGRAGAGLRADAIAGNYEALRTLGLLPYQALIVVTFVIFPLVSRATFNQDKAATAAYIRQTLRIGFVFAGALGVVLGARPEALMSTLYKPEYLEGVRALPLLVAGNCFLAVMGIVCAIINAAGRPKVAVGLLLVALAVGSGAGWVMVQGAALGAPMLTAQAAAQSLGTAAGLVAALVYLKVAFSAFPPLKSLVRIGLAVAAAVAVGRFLPNGGKALALGSIVAVGVVYVAVLVATREFGASDRAIFMKVVRRKKG